VHVVTAIREPARLPAPAWQACEARVTGGTPEQAQPPHGCDSLSKEDTQGHTDILGDPGMGDLRTRALPDRDSGSGFRDSG